MLQYLFWPVSATTSPQCAFRYRGVSEAYYFSTTAEGHKWDAPWRLAATSTISCYWWCLDYSVWKGVGDCHSISYSQECWVPTPRESDHLACYPQAYVRHPHFWSLQNTECCVQPSECCHSMPSSCSSWSHTGYMCTLNALRMGGREYFVGSSQGNPEHHVPIG